MIEIDLYYLYWLAIELHKDDVAPNVFHLLTVKAVIEDFIGHRSAEFLPRTKEKAGEILSLLKPFASSFEAHNPIAHLPEDWEKFHRCLQDFESEFRKEAGHLYIACIENQRLLTPYVLISKIENSVATKTWMYMSRLARREIEESGRCLAFERYTASGFHILRCVESIVREYITACSITLKDSDRNWGRYVDVLKEKGASAEVTSMVDNLRHDDRNTLMHPEKFLNQDEAIGLLNLCQTALDRLINDMEKRGFAKSYTP